MATRQNLDDLHRVPRLSTYTGRDRNSCRFKPLREYWEVSLYINEVAFAHNKFYHTVRLFLTQNWTPGEEVAANGQYSRQNADYF